MNQNLADITTQEEQDKQMETNMNNRDKFNQNFQAELNKAKSNQTSTQRKAAEPYVIRAAAQNETLLNTTSDFINFTQGLLTTTQQEEEGEDEGGCSFEQSCPAVGSSDKKLDDENCRLHVNNVIDNLGADIRSDIDNIRSKATLLQDTLNTKITIFNNLKKDTDTFDKNQKKNTNFVVTTGRLTHFYNDNIKGQNTQNNVLKLAFITVFSVFLLLFRNEIKEIFKGTLEHKSIFVQPELPTIVCLVFMIVYLVWLFNNKNIREVSYFMIATLVGYVLFIQYSSIKLANNPLKSGLFGVAIIPFVLYFIVEKLNLDHNIIPIYKKNTKIAYKLNDDFKSLNLENTELTNNITNYDTLNPKLN